MDLQQMLENARQREIDIHLEFDRKSSEYKNKVLENDGIRRNLQKEEDELKNSIPKQPFEKDSEWGKVLEDIRVLERLAGDE